MIGYIEVEVFEAGPGGPDDAGHRAFLAVSHFTELTRTRRGTLLIDPDQPGGENPADYHTSAITNHYARIVHATTIARRGTHSRTMM